MTIFVCYPDQHKEKKEYVVNNSYTNADNATEGSQKILQENKGIECSSRTVWIRVLWICSIVLSLTICLLATIACRYESTKNDLSSCKCSSDTKRIILRLEELERKVNLYEQSVPAVLEHRLQKSNADLHTVRNKINRGNRSKRQIERQFIEDGVPIVLNEGASGGNASLSSQSRKNTEGLRIYDSWYQNSNTIPLSSRRGRNMQGRSNGNTPIRPHHRKSASWVEQKKKRRKRKKHNLNAHFDDNSIYRRARPGRNKIDHLVSARRSRVSITATESSRSIAVVNPPSTSAPNNDMNRRAMNNRAAVRSLDNRNHRSHHQSGGNRKQQGNTRQLGIHHQVSSSSSNTLSNSLPLVENVNIVPNQRSATLKSGGRQSLGGSIVDQFTGLKSAHFVGKLDSPPVDGNYRNQEVDGKFRHWRLARWAKKMHLEDEFPLNNGTVKVKKPGVYYIYAQINYLDEHDVNAYQVLVNDDPFLLCTVMTNTGRSHSISKANTCYTGGVNFLETDDEISIRDLDVGRHSVIRPAHTFFGLIKLSGLKV